MKFIKVLKQRYFKFKYRHILNKFEVKYLVYLKNKLDDINEQTFHGEYGGLCIKVGLPWRITKYLGRNWKYFSGDNVYPVGGEVEYHYYNNRQELWVGVQKQLRLDYAKHLSTEIGKVLRGIGYEHSN